MALENYAELVDIFPTIAELAGVAVPPRCSSEEESQSMALCTEGVSLAPLIQPPRQQDSDSRSLVPAPKIASFWQ